MERLDSKNCEFCRNLSWVSGPGSPWPSKEDQYSLFHRPCSCEAIYNGLNQFQDRDLCLFCRHLRLPHLVFCPRRDLQTIKVELPSMAKMRSSRCPFCNLIANAVTQQATLLGVSIPDISDLWVHLSSDMKEFETVGNEESGQDPTRGSLTADFIFPESEDARTMDHSAGDNFSAIDIEILNQPLRRAYKIPDSQTSFRPIRGPLVDWDIVREWLKHCEEHHVSQGHGPSFLPKGFRLIDVKRRKVIDAPQKCKFAALSYVWGYNPDPTKLLATKSTIQNLSEDGAIQDSKLPPTISDALEICRRLNQEYLWVDRLCIVQDDNEHKMVQIEAMNNIYTFATITIVQASGDDMESSLPGVVMPRSSRQGQIDILGMRITSIFPKTTNFSYRSSWSKRGWTYQEAALSKKKLVITDLEVIFDCHAEVNWEDRYGLNRLVKSEQYHFYDTMLRDGYRYDDYTRHLESYTSRSLSFQSDIYNAFTAIIKALYAEDYGDKHGLPRKDFNQALLWIPKHWRTPGITPGPRHVHGMMLPSWSWSSLLGTTGPDQNAFMGTLVLWHELRCSEGSNQLQVIPAYDTPWHWNNDWGGPSQKLHDPRLYLGIAWSQDCHVTDSPRESHLDCTFSDLEQSLIKRWPSYMDYWKENIGMQRIDDVGLSLEQLRLSNQIIIGKVERASFKVECARDGVYRIVGHDGGIGILNIAEAKARGYVVDSSVTHELYEFIALSISVDTNGQVLDVDPRFQGEIDALYAENCDGEIPYKTVVRRPDFDIVFFDSAEEPMRSESPPIVNVMLIGTKDGYSTRITTGWILLTKWRKARREIGTICLI